MIDYRAGRTRAVAFRDGTTVDGEASAVTKPTFEEARDEFFAVPALTITCVSSSEAQARERLHGAPPRLLGQGFRGRWHLRLLHSFSAHLATYKLHSLGRRCR